MCLGRLCASGATTTTDCYPSVFTREQQVVINLDGLGNCQVFDVLFDVHNILIPPFASEP